MELGGATAFPTVCLFLLFMVVQSVDSQREIEYVEPSLYVGLWMETDVKWPARTNLG